MIGRVLDPLELALRRLPDENLLAVAGSVDRALMISNEIEPSRAKVDKAELLEELSATRE